MHSRDFDTLEVLASYMEHLGLRHTPVSHNHDHIMVFKNPDSPVHTYRDNTLLLQFLKDNIYPGSSKIIED
jgi:hypothetical protein